MAISNRDIKRELRNILRNADLISITDRGVATVTEEFDGTGAQTAFPLTNFGVKNIRTVTVGGVPQTFNVDWDFAEAIVGTDAVTTVTFVSAPANGTNNVDITYDHSTTGDRIYDDFPKSTVTNSKFPRIGFDIISSITGEKALQGAVIQTNILITIIAYGVGTEQTEELYDSIRALLLPLKTSLQFLNYIIPTGEGPILQIGDTNSKIFSKNLDFKSPFEFEIP